MDINKGGHTYTDSLTRGDGVLLNKAIMLEQGYNKLLPFLIC